MKMLQKLVLIALLLSSPLIIVGGVSAATTSTENGTTTVTSYQDATAVDISTLSEDGSTTASSNQGGSKTSGAIFTTDENGTVVNDNTHYESKEDVYLDGGPGPNAPSDAAGLPEGDYYFQVTTPNGKELLSEDHISCRKVHVNEHGVISHVYEGVNYEKNNGVWEPVPCKHEEGVDQDHSEKGAITVQLSPYSDTTNEGNMYKVWITPVESYTGDPNYIPTSSDDQANGEDYQPGNYHGFLPQCSKTDNFKVDETTEPSEPSEPCGCGHEEPYTEPSVITVKKFHDANTNSVNDTGELYITGWAVYVTDPLNVTNTIFTETTIVAAVSGTYKFEEFSPEGTVQMAGYLDGELVSSYPNANPQIDVQVNASEYTENEVMYGNAGQGEIIVQSINDENGDGDCDEGESGLSDWTVILTGVTYTGIEVVMQLVTDAQGFANFTALMPGTYVVEQIVKVGWEATVDIQVSVDIVSQVSGHVISGSSELVTFLNTEASLSLFGTLSGTTEDGTLDPFTRTIAA